MFKQSSLLFLVLFAVSGLAQKASVPPAFGSLTGSVIDGAITYGYNSFGAIDAAGTDFIGASEGDDLFESWWYYRLDGDTNESPFPDPDTADYSANTITLTWNDVDGRGFSAQLIEEIFDGSGPSGALLSTITLTNNIGSFLSIDIFHFADIDLRGSFDDDSAIISDTGFIRLTDVGTTGEYRAGRPDAVQALAFPGLDPILSDGAVDDLDGSGFPFGPDDFTGAFQWNDLPLAPDLLTGITLQTSFAINQPAPVPEDPLIIFIDTFIFQVPATSTWSLIVLSLLMLTVGSWRYLNKNPKCTTWSK